MNRSTRMGFALPLLALGLMIVSSGAAAETRGPITVIGNAGFTEENGVIAGTGSENDPYVIAGWEIEVGRDDVYGVQIENVTDSFVLRGLIVSNALDPDGAAIRIGFSSGGRIEGCRVSNSINGVQIISTTGVGMAECLIYAFGRGLRVEGESAEDYRHEIEQTNLYNDGQIVYYHGLDGETVEGETTTHLTIADSKNVTITGNDVADGDGIYLAFVTDSTIRENSAFRANPVLTGHGIHLYRSDRNVLISNSVRNNRLAGIQLTLSSDNEIVENQLLANDTGLRLLASDRNRVTDNIAFANVAGIVLTGGSAENEVVGNVVYHENTRQGIALESASGNLIERNGLTDCEIGILLAAEAFENDIVANTIVAGAYGISVAGSSNDIERNLVSQQSRGVIFPETFTKTITRGNAFRGNVFADNGSHVYTNLDSTGNTFAGNAFLGDGQAMVSDHGTGNRWSVDGLGNYWGDAAVTDADGDGIGDEPIQVHAAIYDEAPLATMVPSEAGLGIIGTLEAESIEIEREDGSTIDVEVLRAVEGYERWAGFRGFPEEFLDGFPGILFAFDELAERRFTMLTVLFDLDIAFFGADGLLVGRTTMTANTPDLYSAADAFQYALELPSGELDALSISGDARLLIP
ncbi:NosD domain-containing protein [Candidatus Bipolaricaulota bacterium]